MNVLNVIFVIPIFIILYQIDFFQYSYFNFKIIILSTFFQFNKLFTTLKVIFLIVYLMSSLKLLPKEIFFNRFMSFSH